MRHLIKFYALATCTIFMACSNETSIDKEQAADLKTANLEMTSAVSSTVDIYNPIYDTYPGTSTLHRSANGITVNYKTSGLIPGNAYTLWFAVFNNPEECSGDCDVEDLFDPATGPDYLYATGHVIGASGEGNFSAHLGVGDDSGSIADLFGLPSSGGLNEGKTFSSEIHLVLRDHGPAQPGLIDEQLSQFIGGCVTDLGYFEQDALEVGECSDIEFAIHPPVSN